eukprot:TRINITY_DN4033_c0_g1_i3.p1 TRINITY_DN4033_c0_g1~~TRINITY_DN4033_c0_g1_i3.p1  ORF type:complete len:530 (+),score=75.57 TRINITY_DN4033_c0_g1_i3:733-2322(+)
MAPEVLWSTHYDNRCDLWSIGLLVYEMLQAELPYPLTGSGLDLDFGQDPVHAPDTCSPFCNDLIKRTVCVAKNRMSWSQFFHHPFLCHFVSVILLAKAGRLSPLSVTRSTSLDCCHSLQRDLLHFVAPHEFAASVVNGTTRQLELVRVLSIAEDVQSLRPPPQVIVIPPRFRKAPSCQKVDEFTQYYLYAEEICKLVSDVKAFFKSYNNLLLAVDILQLHLKSLKKFIPARLQVLRAEKEQLRGALSAARNKCEMIPLSSMFGTSRENATLLDIIIPTTNTEMLQKTPKQFPPTDTQERELVVQLNRVRLTAPLHFYSSHPGWKAQGLYQEFATFIEQKEKVEHAVDALRQYANPEGIVAIDHLLEIECERKTTELYEASCVVCQIYTKFYPIWLRTFSSLQDGMRVSRDVQAELREVQERHLDVASTITKMELLPSCTTLLRPQPPAGERQSTAEVDQCTGAIAKTLHDTKEVLAHLQEQVWLQQGPCGFQSSLSPSPEPSDTRPLCVYGAVCHYKNVQHLQKFRHPT